MPDMDIICAWCHHPWNARALSYKSWRYLSGFQAASLNVAVQYSYALTGDDHARHMVSRKVYETVLRGRGCPSITCGFVHGPYDGPHRQEQLAVLLVAGMTDDTAVLM